MISIRLVEDNSLAVIQATEEQIKIALEAVGMEAESRAKLKLEEPKAHKDGSVRPNVDTGRLVNSITHRVKGDTVYIGTNVKYATYVEMGTRRSQAYPFLRPAIEEHITDYRRIFYTQLGAISN